MSYSSSTVFKSMIWKLLERFSSQIVSVIISIILARLVLPEEYGVIAIITIFLAISNVIIDGGLNMALIQKKDADDIDFSTILYFSLLLASGVYLLLFIFAGSIARFYDQDILVPIIRVLGITVFFHSYNAIQTAYVSKHMLFRQLFYSTIGATVVSGILGIVAAYKGLGVWALVIQSVFLSFTKTVIMTMTIRWKPILCFSINRFKSLFDYGWKIFFTNLIVVLYENARGLVIGKVYQPVTLAYFDRGKQWPNLMMSNINTSIQTVLMPTFSEDQDNIAKVKSMVRRSMRVCSYCILPLLCGLFAVAKPLTVLLLTEKWLPAVPFMQIFCLAYMLMPIQNSNMVAIKALGYSDITLKLEVFKKILEAGIMIGSFFIGVKAVAWGIVLYNFICVFINLGPNSKLLNYGISEQLKDVAPIYLIATLMGLFVYPIQFLPIHSNVVLLMVQVVIGILTYYCLTLIFKIDSFDYIKSVIKSLIQR